MTFIEFSHKAILKGPQITVSLTQRQTVIWVHTSVIVLLAIDCNEDTTKNRNIKIPKVNIAGTIFRTPFNWNEKRRSTLAKFESGSSLEESPPQV